MTEESTETPQPSQKDALLDALGALENSPDPAQIAGWKEAFGGVYIAAFDADEVFVFRSLNRAEYRDIQTTDFEPMEYEETVVKKCLLFSSVNSLEQKAGTIPSLLEMIMQNSNFVPPQIAAQLVSKL